MFRRLVHRWKSTRLYHGVMHKGVESTVPKTSASIVANLKQHLQPLKTISSSPQPNPHALLVPDDGIANSLPVQAGGCIKSKAI